MRTALQVGKCAAIRQLNSWRQKEDRQLEHHCYRLPTCSKLQMLEASSLYRFPSPPIFLPTRSILLPLSPSVQELRNISVSLQRNSAVFAAHMEHMYEAKQQCNDLCYAVLSDIRPTCRMVISGLSKRGPLLLFPNRLNSNYSQCTWHLPMFPVQTGVFLDMLIVLAPYM